MRFLSIVLKNACSCFLGSSSLVDGPTNTNAYEIQVVKQASFWPHFSRGRHNPVPAAMQEIVGAVFANHPELRGPEKEKFSDGATYSSDHSETLPESEESQK